MKKISFKNVENFHSNRLAKYWGKVLRKGHLKNFSFENISVPEVFYLTLRDLKKKLDTPYTTPTKTSLTVIFYQILRHPLIFKGRLVCVSVHLVRGHLLPHFATFFKSWMLYNTILAYHNPTPKHELCNFLMLIFKLYHLE